MSQHTLLDRSLHAGRRRHQWTPGESAGVIMVLAIVMGCLFITTYSLALGDPVPHRIDAALVGSPSGHAHTLAALQSVADDSIAFSHYPSLASARHAIDQQQISTALDLTARRPTLYVASAAGASVARVLERVTAVDPTVQVVDIHPLAAHDPSGLEIFYRMLVATIVGFITILQVRAQVPGLLLRHHVRFVITLAILGSLGLTLVAAVLLPTSVASEAEQWGILALHVLAVASFVSLMTVLIGRWAILPTWLFFVILGNTSSGGAVSPPLLPPLFGFISQWLPSGATVTALRNAVYFNGDQHARPILVLAAWAIALFASWWLIAHRREATAGPAPQR